MSMTRLTYQDVEVVELQVRMACVENVGIFSTLLQILMYHLKIIFKKHVSWIYHK